MPAGFTHSACSDPAPHNAALHPLLPARLDALPVQAESLLLHPLMAQQLGVTPPVDAGNDRTARTMGAVLDRLLDRDPRPLDQPRRPQDRFFGVCWHFALFAAALCRASGVPARLRCGFATYFTPGFHEDHWICEAWNGTRWCRVDPELGPETQRQLGLRLDAADLPPGAFLAAAEAWRLLRDGAAATDRFGVSAIGVAGAWFAAASLLRDLAALMGREALPWDYWGPATRFRAEGLGPWPDRLDRLAADLVAVDNGRSDASALLSQHPWAAPADVVTSYPFGHAVEVRLPGG